MCDVWIFHESWSLLCSSYCILLYSPITFRFGYIHIYTEVRINITLFYGLLLLLDACYTITGAPYTGNILHYYGRILSTGINYYGKNSYEASPPAPILPPMWLVCPTTLSKRYDVMTSCQRIPQGLSVFRFLSLLWYKPGRHPFFEQHTKTPSIAPYDSLWMRMTRIDTSPIYPNAAPYLPLTGFCYMFVFYVVSTTWLSQSRLHFFLLHIVATFPHFDFPVQLTTNLTKHFCESFLLNLLVAPNQ